MGKQNVMRTRGTSPRHGFSLLELLACVTIMGVIAVIAIPRFGSESDDARIRSCHVHKGNIEVQSQLWFRSRGRWPRRDLSDIGRNENYFPDGLPVCPLDGSTYEFDSIRERVIGHEHDRP